MGSSKSQTIGHAYFMGLHMVIAKSADALLAIRAGGRNIFTGQRYTAPAGAENGHFRNPYSKGILSRMGWFPSGPNSPVTANERINLFAPDIFGGKEREGGIMGALDVMFGEPTQTANDYLESVLGSPQPAYRGSFGAVFRGGMVGAMNPYLKAWQWRVRRNLKGWQGGTAWYPTACEVDVGGGVKCMNPAHMVYQVLTDAEDGMGYPAAILDDANFRAAADLFKAEGIGLFFKWMQSDKIENFVQQVTEHCNAFVIQNPLTTLFQIIPLRGGYDPETLLTLTPSNAVLETFERTTLEETVNEITVKWDDTFTLNEGSITVQALANINAMGGVVNQTKTYAGVPTETIAKRLAQRDLDIASAQLARMRVKANRVAHGVVPGHVVRLQGFTKLGLQTVLMRVLRVKYGGPDRQEITLEGAEDVFGLPLNSYIGTQPPGWSEPSTTPTASANVDAYEIPFRDLAQIQGAAAAAALSPAAGFFGFSASKPPNLPINFTLITKQGAAAYAEAGSGDFTPTASLSAPIGKTDTILPLTSLSNFAVVDPGMVAFLGTHPTAEAVRIDSITGASVTVARGVLDTVPQVWASGTRLWVYDDYGAADPTEYAAGETVDGKALTVTSTGVLLEAAATADTVAFNSRAARPYPPARLRINAAAWPATSYSRLVVTWNHRDRIVQGDTAVGTDETGIGPEAGTTYTMRVYQEPSTLLDTQAGIAGNTATYDAILAANANLRVEVESSRGGLISWQVQKHTLAAEAGDKVTAGNMATPAAWTAGTGWTVAAGVASKVAGTAAPLSQAIALVAGASYRVEFKVTAFTAGTVRARLTGGATVQGTARAAVGTFVETIVAGAGPTTLELYGDAAFAGSVDDVRLHRLI